MSDHVVVVGAGFLGLTCAVRLLESGRTVTLVADKFHGITSKTAPSAFRPGLMGDIPAERLVQWGRISREIFEDLFKKVGGDAGISKITTIEPFRKDLYEQVGGAEVLAQVCPDFRPATAKELADVDCGNGWAGAVYTNFTIEGSKFLPYLLDRILALGGTIVEATVQGTAPSEEWCSAAACAAGQPESRIIVNCCGLRGGSDSVGLRGTLVLVKAPWLRKAICNYDSEDRQKPTWIVPRQTHVMLGTSKFPGDKTSMAPNEEEDTAKEIIERCAQFDSRLRDAPIISTVTCVRPNRPGGPRVDCVQVGAYHCVNNYGHSTVGATYSWGCASHVVELVRAATAAALPESRGDRGWPSSRL